MPYKFRERRIKEAPRKSPVPRIIGGLFLLGLIGAAPYGWQRYQSRVERQRLERAKEALGRGDTRSALIEARGVLQRNPQNPIAREVVDGASEALKARDTMSWQHANRAFESGDSDQLLGLAEGFILAEDYLTAERALQSVPEAQRQTARYHDLLGRIAAGRADVAGAQKHWEEAARLAPGEASYRIKPVALRLVAEDPATRAEAARQLHDFKQDPALALAAQRVFAADAIRRQDFAQMREFALELSAMPGAEFGDQMLLLNALHSLRQTRRDEFDAALARLEQAALAQPQDVLMLATWMIEHDLAFRVIEWSATLPPDLVTTTPAAPAFAQAFVETSEWSRLKSFVESATWGEQEFLRLGYHAFALHRMGNREASRTIWEEAAKAAQLAPDRLERLARACARWGWREPTDDLLAQLAASAWCPRWVLELLWTQALERNETARLAEVARLRLRIDPRNAEMRNNVATFALLTGDADDAIHRDAQAVHEENPGRVEMAATHAYSLFLQGRPDDARKVLETFPPEKLRHPVVAIYYGALLVVAGEMDRAREFLRLGDNVRKLAEESAMARVFTGVCDARALSQKGEKEPALAAWNEALRRAERQPAWLEQLTRAALAWQWSEAADAALLKLAVEDRCPPGAEENLWQAAVKTGNATQLYRASRLLARVKPQDATVRTRYVQLAALGQRSKEPPSALAEQLAKDFPASAEAAATHALALLQEDKTDRAVQIIEAIPAERRTEPRVALYRGIVIATTGRIDEATKALDLGAPSAQYAEEKALVAMMRAAFATASSTRAGAIPQADQSWAQALAAAGDRADWVSILARLALASSDSRHATTALWKLAASESCPLWAAEALWNAVATAGPSPERYRAAKVLAKANTRNLTARTTWITLGLLTNQELDAPHREAKTTYSAAPLDSGAATTYALSLFLQKQRSEALKLLGGLPAAQQAEPRVAFYYGVLLGAGGDAENAAAYLRSGASAALLPEERSFAESTLTSASLRALLTPAR